MREPQASPPKEAVRPFRPFISLLAVATLCFLMLTCFLSLQKTARAADPMSFASILSGPTEEQAPPKRQSPPPGLGTIQSAVPSVNATSLNPPPASFHPKVGDIEPVPPVSAPRLEKKPSADKRQRNTEKDLKSAENPTNGVTEPPKILHPPRRIMSEKETEMVNKYMVEIDNAEKSDVEAPGFEQERERYILKGKKRALDVERAESIRRKVCFYQPSSYLCLTCI